MGQGGQGLEGGQRAAGGGGRPEGGEGGWGSRGQIPCEQKAFLAVLAPEGCPPMADPRFQDFRAKDQGGSGRFLGGPPIRAWVGFL